MNLLDEAYAEHKRIIEKKDRKLSVDWNACNEWKSIVDIMAKNLEFKWSKNLDNTVYLYFEIDSKPCFSSVLSEKEDKFIKDYYKESIIIKLYSDKHSFLAELFSNLSANADYWAKFVSCSDSYSIPHCLEESFSKIYDLVTSKEQLPVIAKRKCTAF